MNVLLEQEFATADRLHVVAHGAPPELHAAADSVEAREHLLVPADIPVMSTFGLLSPGKGIELGIEAVALLGDRYPELHYIVAGRTHPEVAKEEGETTGRLSRTSPAGWEWKAA
jgi:glycosyltransferase involved in cell wall biosynthesis